MKKIISLLLVSLMVLALVSCAGGGGGASQNQKVKFNIDDYVVVQISDAKVTGLYVIRGIE